MNFDLITGPAASGKTHTLIREALDTLAFDPQTGSHKRVWWVGLPHQRNMIMRRLTQETPVLLGLEYMTTQQLYTRLLSSNSHLKNAITNTERIALTAAALHQHHQDEDESYSEQDLSPGEAKLFAHAIAEAKRHNLTPDDLPTSDPETDVLQVVYRNYEALKGQEDAWDYDDFRLQTHACLTQSGSDTTVEADLIIVDGFRTLTALEASIFELLSQHARVIVATQVPPDTMKPNRVLPDREGVTVSAHRADNPIDELRWVLRSVKRDIANGTDPLDIGIIAPERDHAFLQTLSREYGVPLMPTLDAKLQATGEGSLLHDLLTFADSPTPAKLERLPGLFDLSVTARRLGMTGLDGIQHVADTLGVREELDGWVEKLTAPAGAGVEWACSMIDLIPDVAPHVLSEAWPTIREVLITKAKEARHLGGGDVYRRWFAALAATAPIPMVRNGGVSLLTPVTASGVQFERAYLTGATEGSYTLGEAEDFFVPEEWRDFPDVDEDDDATAEQARADEFLLPRRFRGFDRLLHEELRSRAPEVIVTFAAADQNATYIPLAGVVGTSKPDEVPRLPRVPAGSRVELMGFAPFTAPEEFPETDLPRSMRGLKRFSECKVRYWFDRHAPGEDDTPWWRELVRDLYQFDGFASTETLLGIASRFPDAKTWLTEKTEYFSRFKFGVRLPKEGDGLGLPSFVDAAGMVDPGEVTILRFVEPESVEDRRGAQKVMRPRFNEFVGAHQLLEDPKVKAVRLVVVPVLGEPVEAYKVTPSFKTMKSRVDEARSALGALEDRVFEPTPGFHCRECPYAHACRKDVA